MGDQKSPKETLQPQRDGNCRAEEGEQCSYWNLEAQGRAHRAGLGPSRDLLGDILVTDVCFTSGAQRKLLNSDV